MHRRNYKEDFAFMSLLKACAKKKDLCTGSKLHVDILKRGLLEDNPYIGSAIISMYAECGELSNARQVLEKLPVRHVISWNALIAGYVHQGRSRDAMNCFELMESEGLCPDAVTFTFFLKACGQMKDISRGKQVHEKIMDKGFLEKDVVLGTTLVEMYAKCGTLGKARKVLEELPIRDEVAWNALIAGYIQEGRGHEMLKCFEQMKGDRIAADAATFLFALKACCITQDIEKGKDIHDEIVSRGLLMEDIFLGTALVDMYTKCGDLAKAQEVLEELPLRDEVSWNTLIVGYTQKGQVHEALNCFERMESEGFSGNAVSFTCILNVCGTIGAIDKGKKIHEEIVARGLLEKDNILGNALLTMYAKCGELAKASEVLKELPLQDVVSWSTLIMGYAQLGHDQEALNCFEEMQNAGFEPDATTLICILKICGRTGSIEKGKQIHDKIATRVLLAKDIVLGTALVDMYAKCGMLAKAQQALEDLPTRDTVSWNALISGYTQQGQGLEALNCFQQMQSEGLSPDAVTFICALKACGNIEARDMGKEIHDEIVSRGLLRNNTQLGTALVDMYAKCGVLVKAQQVLEELHDQNIVTWNALIAGYTQHDEYHEALNCFERMQTVGISPNMITFICILKACGSMGALDKGNQIHEEVLSRFLLEKHVAIGSALVDMYAKCGAFTKAREVLELLPYRNLISWSALISGYAQQGHVSEALNCFEQMENEGISPDDVTFLCVLNACSHAGQLDEAQILFMNMTRQYGIIPNLEHYTCMMVVFGGLGYVDDAMLMMKVMPSSHDVAVWLALLTASRKWGNMMLAKLAFDETVQLCDSSMGPYTSVADISTSAKL